MQAVMESVLRGGKHRGMSWRKLVLTPPKYLELCRWYRVEDMSEEEAEQYYRLLREHGHEVTQCDIDFLDGMHFNAFLEIQVCFALHRITLSCDLYSLSV